MTLATINSKAEQNALDQWKRNFRSNLQIRLKPLHFCELLLVINFIRFFQL